MDPTGPAPRPLLFLDVDGPLIPMGGDGSPTHRPRSGGNPLLDRVDPRHGAWLAALPCDLVWATTWEAEANEVIAPLRPKGHALTRVGPQWTGRRARAA
jgi:hypothetical protein